MAGKAGKKVNLAKVFKETEQFQKPDLEVVESTADGPKESGSLSREEKTYRGLFRRSRLSTDETHRYREEYDDPRYIGGSSQRMVSDAR